MPAEYRTATVVNSRRSRDGEKACRARANGPRPTRLRLRVPRRSSAGMSVLPYETPPAAPARAARSALLLLLTINLFNYIDRYVLSAVEPEIRKHFFAEVEDSTRPAKELKMEAMAKTGSLATAFLVTYMVAAPVFGWLATRMSRWVLVGLSVAIWSLASGASGLAMTFGVLV